MARPSEAVALLDEPCVAAAPLVVDAPLAARCAGCAPACAGTCGCAGSLELDIRLIAQSGAVGEPAVAAARAAQLDTQAAVYAATAHVIAAAPAIAAVPAVADAPISAVGYGYAGPLNLNTQLVAHPNKLLPLLMSLLLLLPVLTTLPPMDCNIKIR